MFISRELNVNSVVIKLQVGLNYCSGAIAYVYTKSSAVVVWVPVA